MSHTNEVTIRTAKSADAPALADLSTQLGYPTSASAAGSRLTGILDSGGHAVFAACLPDGTVVGWAHVFMARRVESDAFAELGGFVVAEGYRRRGIGERLLAATEEWAARQGATKLRVRTRTGRDDAIAFYGHWGFQGTKEQSVLDKPLSSDP